MSDYSLFSVIGIEIEYMLVDKTSLNIQPKSDVILKELAGELVARGPSNPRPRNTSGETCLRTAIPAGPSQLSIELLTRRRRGLMMGDGMSAIFSAAWRAR